jgi:hypothetical protein
MWTRGYYASPYGKQKKEGNATPTTVMWYHVKIRDGKGRWVERSLLGRESWVEE